MMRIYFPGICVLILIGLTACSRTEQAKPSLSGPKFVRFQTIRSGGEATRTLRYQNVTKAPLSIREVYRSCGCTRVTMKNSSNELSPGETLILDVTVTGRPDKRGEIGFVRIDFVDDSIESVKTRVLVDRITGIDVTPSRIDFATLQHKELKGERSVFIRDSDQQIDPDELTIMTSSKVVSVGEGVVEEGGVRYNVSVNPVVLGELRESIVIQDPEGTEHTITVTGYVQGDVFAVPRSIILTSVGPERVVRIRNKVSDQEIQISNAAISESLAQCLNPLQLQQTGEEYLIRVSINDAYKPITYNPIRGHVDVVYSVNDVDATLRVPVTAVLEPQQNKEVE